jgi:hypothetical protein
VLQLQARAFAFPDSLSGLSRRTRQVSHATPVTQGALRRKQIETSLGVNSGTKPLVQIPIKTQKAGRIGWCSNSGLGTRITRRRAEWFVLEKDVQGSYLGRWHVTIQTEVFCSSGYTCKVLGSDKPLFSPDAHATSCIILLVSVQG